MSGTNTQSARGKIPSRFLRTVHWLNALAILIMVGSGWRIYSWYPALPMIPLDFPWPYTLGGDLAINEALHNEWGLANALAWHFGAMWLLVINFMLYLSYGIATGHFRRDFLPLGPKTILQDLLAALRGKLSHELGSYNAVQKAFYWLVIAAILTTILSGLAIWKSAQFSALSSLFGGYETARVVHFFGMAVIVGFVLVHVTLAVIVPETLVAMVLGREWHRKKTQAAAPVPESRS